MASRSIGSRCCSRLTITAPIAQAAPPHTWLVVVSDHGFSTPGSGVADDPGDLAGPASAWHRPYGIVGAIEARQLLADSSATFALPPARLGLAYPLDGLRDLVSAVGGSMAKTLIFTAERIPAEEALRIGLIDHLVSDIDADTANLCRGISEGAPFTIAHAKRAIDLIAGAPVMPDRTK